MTERDLGVGDVRERLLRRLVELLPRLRLFCARHLPDGSLVDDAVSDVVWTVWTHLDTRDQSRSFDAHVLATARFVCLNTGRRGRRRDAADLPLPGDAERPDAELVLRGTRRRATIAELYPFLDACVDRLAEKDRQLYALCWGPGSAERSMAEVATRLGTTVVGAQVRKSRLKKQLEACARAAFDAARADSDSP